MARARTPLSTKRIGMLEEDLLRAEGRSPSEFHAPPKVQPGLDMNRPFDGAQWRPPERDPMSIDSQDLPDGVRRTLGMPAGGPRDHSGRPGSGDIPGQPYRFDRGPQLAPRDPKFATSGSQTVDRLRQDPAFNFMYDQDDVRGGQPSPVAERPPYIVRETPAPRPTTVRHGPAEVRESDPPRVREPEVKHGPADIAGAISSAAQAYMDLMAKGSDSGQSTPVGGYRRKNRAPLASLNLNKQAPAREVDPEKAIKQLGLRTAASRNT